MSRTAHGTLAGLPLGWPEPALLRRRSVLLPAGAPIDPFALAVGSPGARPGFVMASAHSVVVGCGAAAVLPLPDGLADERATAAVRGWLAAVPGADAEPPDRLASSPPGPVGPVAVGALPFSPDEPGRLVVPSLCYVRHGDDERVVLVGPATVGDTRATVGDTRATSGDTRGGEARDPAALRDALRRASADGGAGGAAPGRGRLLGLHDEPGAAFAAAVRRALDAIDAGPLTKVVLARRVVASFDAALDPVDVLRRLAEREPTATVYGVADDEGAFLGASPELLVARSGTHVESWPLAGTVARTGDAAADAAAERALVHSPKELDEHRQTVDAIRRALASFCTRPPEVCGPSVARLRSVAHLATRLSGTLADDVDVLSLVRALHPTPAVAGSPTPDAMALLRSLEPGGRGRYAGPVGWIDAHGDGEWVVAIRGASVTGRRATLHAGAGIVAGSDPDRELAETTLKLRTALGALGASDPPAD